MEILDHLDVHNYLVKNPVSTYLMRVAPNGYSMKDAGIYPGDILVVDKAAQYKSRSIVVAAVNGEFTLKRLILNEKSWELWPENKSYPVIKLNNYDEMTVWGTVIGVVRKFNNL